jgi:hypothetical protein
MTVARPPSEFRAAWYARLTDGAVTKRSFLCVRAGLNALLRRYQPEVAPAAGLGFVAGMLAIPTDLKAIEPLIQLSISPVILISGLGALVISMTTRMGRIVDRSRALAGLVRQAKGGERAHIENQLEIMVRRARLMRLAMTLVISSIFMSGSLIMLLFVAQVAEVQLANVALGIFMLSLMFMLGGMAAFIRDVYLSLNALNIEVTHALGHEVD